MKISEKGIGILVGKKITTNRFPYIILKDSCLELTFILHAEFSMRIIPQHSR